MRLFYDTLPGSLALFLVCSTSAAFAQHAADPQSTADRTATGSAPDTPEEPSAAERHDTLELRWNERPTLRIGDLRLDFRARVQAEIRRSEAPLDEDGAAVDVERQRVGVEGTLGKVLEFEIERELKDAAPWRDVYVDYRQFGAARVKAGRFKLPFSLDENTGARSHSFVNRSMAASALAPGRDQGVMVHGRIWGRTFAYEAGVFAHDGDNARAGDDLSQTAGRTTAVRLSTEPGRSGIYTAVAFATSDVPESLWTIRGLTPLDSTFFSSALWVRGTRRRLGLEARWSTGPFTLQSEYLRLTQERLAQGVQGTNLNPVVASGWYLSGTWVVAGQRTTRGLGTRARSALQGGIGAVEIAARLEALTFGELDARDASVSPRAEAVLGNRERALTLGVNWYLTRNLKLQGNVIREALDDPSRGPLPSQPSYWSRVLRLQVAL